MEHHVFLSELSRAHPIVIMQVAGNDGGQCNIYVGEDDNVTHLAEQFCGVYGLANHLVARVAGQILAKKNDAVESRNLQKQDSEVASPPVPQLPSPTASTAAEEAARRALSPSDNKSVQSSSQQQYPPTKEPSRQPRSSQGGPIEVVYPQHNSNDSAAESSVSRDGSSASRKQRSKSADGIRRKPATETSFDAGSLGNSTSTASRKNIYERLYSYADLHKLRRDQLKENVNQERINDVEKTTFRFGCC
jgi:hypothetical protein